jgi:hypothetical protein
MYMQPFELREWALERHHQLTRDYQESCASQRRMMQRLGSVLHWLGNQFVHWGQQLQQQEQVSHPFVTLS